MLRVHFQHALRLRLVIGGTRHAGKHLLHFERQRAFGRDAGRRVGQARGHGHLLHLVAQRFLHGLEQVLVVLGGRFGFFLLFLGLQTQVAAGHVLERPGGQGVRVVVIGHGVVGHGAHAELVNVLRAQQHVVPAAQHRGDDGHLGKALHRFARRVVHGLLPFRRGSGVFGQRDHLLFLGGIEQQQVGQRVLVHAVAGIDAVLQRAAEIVEELLIGLAIVVAHTGQVGNNLLLDAAGDGLQLAVVLQRLARDVQGEVLAVHHAAHEVQVVGQQLLALFHDQHVGAVQGQALLVVLAVQVIGCAAGHEQQRVVGQRAFRMQRYGARRVGEVVEVRLVELVVFLLGDVGLLALPDGDHGVDGFQLGVAFVFRLVVVARVLGLGQFARLGHVHADGIAHVVAVALDEVLQAVLGQVPVIGLRLGAFALGLGVLLQREDDIGAMSVALSLFDGVAFHAVAFPCPSLVGAPGARHHAHLGRHHERGIEADAELADDVDVLALLLGVVGLEGLAVGMRDGAQVLVQLVFRHADAVVRHGDGAGVLVEGHVDAQVVLAHLDVLVGQAAEVQLVDCIRRVGHELAQEYLAVRVDGVDHQIEQLPALGLELSHGERPFPFSLRIFLRMCLFSNMACRFGSLRLRVLTSDCSLRAPVVKHPAHHLRTTCTFRGEMRRQPVRLRARPRFGPGRCPASDRRRFHVAAPMRRAAISGLQSHPFALAPSDQQPTCSSIIWNCSHTTFPRTDTHGQRIRTPMSNRKEKQTGTPKKRYIGGYDGSGSDSGSGFDSSSDPGSGSGMQPSQMATVGLPLVLLACAIGFAVGLAVFGLLRLANFLVALIWERGLGLAASALPDGSPIAALLPLFVCTAGGLAIGLWTKLFDNAPESLEQVMGSVRKTGGYRVHGPVTSAVSFLLPLAFGGSVGPEAGLTGLIAAGCTWIGTTLKEAGLAAKSVVDLTLSASFSAIFGAPFMGIAAAAENDAEEEDKDDANDASDDIDNSKPGSPTTPHATDGDRGHDLGSSTGLDPDQCTFRRSGKIVLYTAAAFGAFGAVRLLCDLFGASAGLPRFDSIDSDAWGFLWAVPLALCGWALALVFFASERLFGRAAKLFKGGVVARPVIAGIVLGAVGCLFPLALFSGEEQCRTLATSWNTYAAGMLLATGVAKIAATALCLNFGWRGGHFFPCIFAGVSFGYGCALLTGLDPMLCVTVIATSLMAAVMRKPLVALLLLVMCFPVDGILFSGIAAVIGAGLPLPKFLMAHHNAPEGPDNERRTA